MNWRIKAGIIGLGRLGASIARRLARAGFDVIACDIGPQMLEAFDEPEARRERATPWLTALGERRAPRAGRPRAGSEAAE